MAESMGNALRRLRDESGQSTVEYAVVMVAFLAVILGLGALWHMLQDAQPIRHALISASHHVASMAPGALADVFYY